MSFAIDANVLLYASDKDNLHHEAAQEFLKKCTHNNELFYLPWPTIMAYLRIATHPAIFTSPLTPQQANKNIDFLLRSPHAFVLSEVDDFWVYYQQATKGMTVRGNLVPDAHIATILLSHGVREIVTNDSDFRRFNFLRVRNPFISSRS